MKPRFYRVAIVAAIVALCGLIAIQSYWLSEAYSINEKQFDEKVNLSLRNVADKILKKHGDLTSTIQAVQKTSANRFFVRCEHPFDYAELDSLIRLEFARQHLDGAFSLAIYNVNDSLLLGGLYPQGPTSADISCLGRDQQTAKLNFAVVFPDKRSEITNGMSLWVFSAGLFAAVLILFALMIFDLSKQKKIAEIKNDFINNMTHELKTPITNISMAAEVLSSNHSLQEDKRSRYLQIIREENTRMKHQVEEVLQTALMDSGHLVLSNDIVDLHKVIADVVSKFQVRIHDRGGKITTDLSSTRNFVKGDTHHLTNLFYNLLDNAEKYSREAPVIIVSTADENGGLRISISDKGIGISKESQKQIFDKFYRASTGDQHDVKGFGLGLNYVAKIVRAHSGKISVVSEMDKGSRFDVSFPSMPS